MRCPKGQPLSPDRETSDSAMKTSQRMNASGHKRTQGYTLVEVLFATALTSIMFFAALSAITYSKVQLARDHERAIATDFAVHYIETLRGMKFDDLVPGTPINPLYDGVGTNEFGKKMTLRIPNSGDWVTMNATNYTSFTPDLAWLVPRNPELSLNLATTSVGGVVRTRQATLFVRWDAPLKRGGKEMLRMDMLRLRDIEPSQ